MKKNQTQVDNGIIELDSAKDAQLTKESGPDEPHPADAATHNDPVSVSPPRTQSACQSSRHGSRREPEAHDVRSLLAHMPIFSPISQHKDPLDDILEALLKDCNCNAAGSGSASRAISSHRNINVGDEARIPITIQEHTRVPAHDFIGNVYDKDARTFASNVSKDPCSASLQQDSALGPRSTHTTFTGSVYHPNRPDLGCFQGRSNMPTQNQMDSRDTWNSYDNIYQRQQDQADLMPDSGEHVPFYAAMRDDLSGPPRVTNHAIAPDEHAQNFHPGDLGDGSDYYNPYLHKRSREWDENGIYEEIVHGECHDRFVDNWTRQNSDVIMFDESRKGYDHGIMANSDMSDYQEREISADDEQPIARDAGQHEVRHQLFTTNISGTYPTLRSQNAFDRNYAVKKNRTDAQIHKNDVEPALSGFWTPHKLY